MSDQLIRVGGGCRCGLTRNYDCPVHGWPQPSPAPPPVGEAPSVTTDPWEYFHAEACNIRFVSTCGNSQRCNCGLDAALASERADAKRIKDAFLAHVVQCPQCEESWRRALTGTSALIAKK